MKNPGFDLVCVAYKRIIHAGEGVGFGGRGARAAVNRETRDLYLSIFLSIYSYINVCIHTLIYIHLSIYPSLYRSIYPSSYLSIYIYLSASIHEYIYLYISVVESWGAREAIARESREAAAFPRDLRTITSQNCESVPRRARIQGSWTCASLISSLKSSKEEEEFRI